MESLKQGANYVSEQVQKATSGTSKEANKEVAKDANQNVGTRYVLPSAASIAIHRGPKC
jgi:hypothetical protein